MLHTPAQWPTVQLNSYTIYVKMGTDPTGKELSSTRPGHPFRHQLRAWVSPGILLLLEDPVTRAIVGASHKPRLLCALLTDWL